MKILRVITVTLILFVLASCGGGGGGGSGSGSGSSSFRITLDTTSVNLTRKTNQYASTMITATASGSYSGTLYIGTVVEGDGIDQNITWVNSGNNVYFTLNAAGGLAAGTYTGRVLFYACSDAYCNHPVGGTPLVVSYTVEIQTIFTVSTPTLNFSTAAGTVPTPQDVTLTPLTGARSWSYSITYNSGTPGWLNFASPPYDMPVTFKLGASAMPVGTYQATITFTLEGESKSVVVNYSSYAGLHTTPAAIDFTATAGTAPVSQSLTLSSDLGSTSWTSSVVYGISTPGWLSVTPSSGATLPATITFNAAAMPAGRYQATVTFNAGGLAKSVVVNLFNPGPQINYVSPYVGTTNVSRNVIIRGSGFLGVSNPTVKFGATPATTFTVVSDSEVSATYPALAQGTYAVTLGDGSTTLSSRANLEIVNAPAYAYATIPRPSFITSFVTRMLYDAERRKLYLYDQNNDQLEVYGFDGASWALDTSIAFGSLVDARIAMSPDGRELLKINPTSISRFDLTAGLARTDVSVASLIGGGWANAGSIAFANDGRAMCVANSATVSLYRFDVLANQLSTVSTSSAFRNYRIDATGDYSKLLLSPINVLGSRSLFLYDASANALSPTSLSTDDVRLVSTDRTGSKTIIVTNSGGPSNVTTVYNASFVALGTLPASSGIVISPDGAFAYAYVPNMTNNGTIHKYNLNSPNGSGGFNEVGTGTVLADTTDEGGGFAGTMTISPDGGTLFLAGMRRVLIVPVP